MFHFAQIEITGAVNTPEEFLPCHAGIMLIALDIRSTSLAEERRKKKERITNSDFGWLPLGVACSGVSNLIS